MKRWPLRILLCLIFLAGGAITTVAVAWGCAVVGDYSDYTGWIDPESPALAATVGDFETALEHVEWMKREQRQYVPQDENTLQFFSPRLGVASGPFVDETIIELSDVEKHPNEVSTTLHHDLKLITQIARAGWPRRSFQAERTYDHRLETDAEFETRALYLVGPRAKDLFDAGFVGNAKIAADRWRPIWAGFVINTLFYAAIWFGVFFGFTSAKRFIRAKRGRCPRCGYDLRGQRMGQGQDARATGCPECGWKREGISA